MEPSRLPPPFRAGGFFYLAHIVFGTWWRVKRVAVDEPGYAEALVNVRGDEIIAITAAIARSTWR